MSKFWQKLDSAIAKPTKFEKLVDKYWILHPQDILN